ncbi:MAG: hypothetical protein AAGE52_07075 [Myxococcota bacterium]
MVVVTDNLLGALVSSSTDFGALRRLGESLGEEAKRHLSDVNGAAPEAVLAEAASALGVFGWGKLGFERWGDALVAILESAPQTTPDVMEAVLGGFFSKIGERDIACVSTGEGRFLLVSPSVAQVVAGWAAAGEGLTTILGKLGGRA